MADNVLITPGSGASIAADLVSGAYYQRVKVVGGPDGTVNDVATRSLPATGAYALEIGTRREIKTSSLFSQTSMTAAHTYSSGQQIGVRVAIGTSAGATYRGFRLLSVQVGLDGNLTPDIDFVLRPTSDGSDSAPADAATYDIGTGALGYGPYSTVRVASTDYVVTGTSAALASVAPKVGNNAYQYLDSSGIYVNLVSRGAGFAWTGTVFKAAITYEVF